MTRAVACLLALLAQWGSGDDCVSCDIDGGGVGITDLIQRRNGPGSTRTSDLTLIRHSQKLADWPPKPMMRRSLAESCAFANRLILSRFVVPFRGSEQVCRQKTGNAVGHGFW